MNDWWTEQQAPPPVNGEKRAVAYYRHSAQDKQVNSIPLQREQVRQWADQHGLEVIQEFADHGKSGLSTEGRFAFLDMLENWVKKRNDFRYILVLDVSRWGRFQDTDLGAAISQECTQHGKTVVYTSLGMPNQEDPLYSIFVNFERFRAAQYSRELGDKVSKGILYLSAKGYWHGGPPPLGFRRMLVDEKGNHLHELAHGERKAIQNHRVVLVPGPEREVNMVRRIFHLFTVEGMCEREISQLLQNEPTPYYWKHNWCRRYVHEILRNATYAGHRHYATKSFRLNKLQKKYNRSKWKYALNAHEPLISQEVFDLTQKMIVERRFSARRVKALKRVREIYDRQETMPQAVLTHAIRDSLLRKGFHREYGDQEALLHHAYQELLDRGLETVKEELRKQVSTLEEGDRFWVVNRTHLFAPHVALFLSIGAISRWCFRLDSRAVIDFNLCVLMDTPRKGGIVHYLVLPRTFKRLRALRIASLNDPLVETYGSSRISEIKEFCG